MTLVGVPGIGKSRLVYELFQTIETGDFGLVFWRHGRSLPYGEGVTFWALGEMVKAQAGILESDSPEQAGEKLEQAVTRFVDDAANAAWLERQLRPLAGLETEEAWAGGRREEAFAAWRRFLEAIADERPLVLVFEDLHWADDALLDFVDYLVDWASGVPLLVLGTARPELLSRQAGLGWWQGELLDHPPLGAFRRGHGSAPTRPARQLGRRRRPPGPAARTCRRQPALRGGVHPDADLPSR